MHHRVTILAPAISLSSIISSRTGGNYCENPTSRGRQSSFVVVDAGFENKCGGLFYRALLSILQIALQKNGRKSLKIFALQLIDRKWKNDNLLDICNLFFETEEISPKKKK